MNYMVVNAMEEVTFYEVDEYLEIGISNGTGILLYSRALTVIFETFKQIISEGGSLEWVHFIDNTVGLLLIDPFNTTT